MGWPSDRGRSDPAGFPAVIKAVGTGPRGSRALTFDEAREATAGLLGGEVSPVQAGAFLVAMRIKGETPAELAGVTQALRDAARRVAPERAPGGRPARRVRWRSPRRRATPCAATPTRRCPPS